MQDELKTEVGIRRSLDYVLAQEICPRLIEFRATIKIAPMAMFPSNHVPFKGRDEPNEVYEQRMSDAEYLAKEKWRETIDQMIYAFSKILDDKDWTWEYDHYQKDRVQTGLELFGKYFRNLWL